MKVTAIIMAFYLLLGSLIPRSDFKQLAYLPNLISHYQLHQQEAKILGQDFGFADFIYVHYINPTEHVQDEQHRSAHEQLPFQSFASNIQFWRFIFNHSMSLFIKPIIQLSTKYDNCFYLDGYNFKILHPPSYLIITSKKSFKQIW